MLKPIDVRRRGAALVVFILFGLLLAAAATLLIRDRLANCAPVPLLADNLLPNAQFASTTATASLPDGWSSLAPGAQLRRPAADGEGFDYDGDGRALQLIGIANAVESPPTQVASGRDYCFRVRTLTDSVLGSATRVRLAFRWFDSGGQLLAEDTGAWQPVALWTVTAPPGDWSHALGAFRAPPGATTLVVRIAPASDDRIYLDMPRLQPGLAPARTPDAAPAPVSLGPWPNGARGALSLSFDWETAMGGLIHSRSVDDPYGDADPILRAMRMRDGVTTTLALFRPYTIRATYFANGYNFLLGNTERRTFMGDPTFAWARTEPPYAWRTDDWTRRRWFAPDPYGTVQSDPAWYFGDLTGPLLQEHQDLQSHTFSHLYAGFAAPAELRADLAAWRAVAAERNVAPARALAFPWSGSAGLSDSSWAALEAAGITAVTRTNRSQPQYQIVRAEDVRCRPVPGHERILACPDYYLTTRSAPQAIALIDRAIERDGMIDLWAHTEEVTTPEQIAAWGAVVEHAAGRAVAGDLWIAPLAEIAGWQQALASVHVTASDPGGADLAITVTNAGTVDLAGLTLRAPFTVGHATIEGAGAADDVRMVAGAAVVNLPAGATIVVRLWHG